MRKETEDTKPSHRRNHKSVSIDLSSDDLSILFSEASIKEQSAESPTNQKRTNTDDTSFRKMIKKQRTETNKNGQHSK